MTKDEIMKEMRDELANANQQIGIITACLDIQNGFLKNNGNLSVEDKQTLIDLTNRMQSACKRA